MSMPLVGATITSFSLASSFWRNGCARTGRRRRSTTDMIAPFPKGFTMATDGKCSSCVIGPDERILVTGAAGFIGVRVVEELLDRGFRNLICLVRPSSDLARLETIIERHSRSARIDIVKGNLLSRLDCEAVCNHVAVLFHLAAGTGEKSFPDAFM